MEENIRRTAALSSRFRKHDGQTFLTATSNERRAAALSVLPSDSHNDDATQHRNSFVEYQHKRLRALIRMLSAEFHHVKACRSYGIMEYGVW